ncbi:MAG: RNA-binding protein, partial [Sphingobacteriaceae bacterium]|nr:RNA-binding protein [Cytophagaceae bacterium]
LVREASYLYSAYVENLSDGNFKLHPLPLAAQVAPVFGIVTDDFDADGNLDALLVGNDFGNEVLSGRQDALNGLLLRGDGRGGFTPLTIQQSGFYVPGDAKGLAKLAGPKGEHRLMATQNRGPLRAFEVSKPARLLRLQPTDAVAELTYPDGKRRREELPYGSSFYSQSGRWLRVPGDVKRVDVTDSRGKRRVL